MLDCCSHCSRYRCFYSQSWMDQYFERMARFSETLELPARIRFMLQDCLELRRNNVSRAPSSDKIKTSVQLQQQPFV